MPVPVASLEGVKDDIRLTIMSIFARTGKRGKTLTSQYSRNKNSIYTKKRRVLQPESYITIRKSQIYSLTGPKS
jgi:hypothetical protein